MEVEGTVTSVTWSSGSLALPRLPGPVPDRVPGWLFSNVVRARIRVREGTLVDWSFLGRGRLDADAVGRLPVLRDPPEIGPVSVRFVQTAGGVLPGPGSVTTWTTLGLTLGFDGSVLWDLVSASPGPAHTVHDHTGALRLRVGGEAPRPTRTRARDPWEGRAVTPG